MEPHERFSAIAYIIDPNVPLLSTDRDGRSVPVLAVAIDGKIHVHPDRVVLLERAAAATRLAPLKEQLRRELAELHADAAARPKILPPDRRTKVPDQRIVYGAYCVWWDSLDKAAEKPSGLPCCPHCGGVLFEVESLAVWDASVASYAIKSGNPDYPAYIKWLRGRCFSTSDQAAAAFLNAKALERA